MKPVDERPPWESPRLLPLGTPGAARGANCLPGSAPGVGSACNMGTAADTNCKNGYGDNTKCNPGRVRN